MRCFGVQKIYVFYIMRLMNSVSKTEHGQYRKRKIIYGPISLINIDVKILMEERMLFSQLMQKMHLIIQNLFMM